MNVLELLDAKVSSYSKTERRIYESIKKFPSAFAKDSITKLTDDSEFSKPALTRFAQKLGFSGFVEFQYQLGQDLEEKKSHREKSAADVYSSILKQTEDSIDPEQLERVAKYFSECSCIYLAGANLSGLPAREMLYSMRIVTDKYAAYLEADSLPLRYHEDDLVIVYSAISGKSHAEMMKSFRKEDAVLPKRILITTNAKHPLRHNFDEVVVLPSVSMAVGDDAPLSDTFSFLFFNEMLIRKYKEMEQVG